ncbi:extracellular solute-binding protein [Sphingobium sp. YR768]|uniref:extracellular solute-binding protein n=1 Tax=Sphingobium sp. YR768 TaxID=1884365 RepID=UPI0008CA5D83|nr:extracellular solute-binding protein [Sphingobium sp. YR768]SES19096.1 carbohydrate ABC transporter substrate-binding protein, CUT1 family [Sphingobium sp. YR768]
MRRSPIMFSAMVLLTASCGEKPVDTRANLHLWQHQTGPEEHEANKQLIARFNAGHPDLKIHAQTIPQGSYPQSVMAAAMAGRLPCVLTVDSPMVPAFVWAGHIRPLDDLIDRNAFAEIAPAGLGRYNGHIYAVGQFDAALAIFTRRSTLAQVGARIPTVQHPWTREEFDGLLGKLKATGRWQVPLDLGTREPNPNWWTYAYSPLLQSFGGDLIDRGANQTAQGVLNGPAAQQWAVWFRSLFVNGFARRQEPDDQSLLHGRVAMAYTGNWRAPDLEKAFGKDLLILPPPDLGHGVVIGGGSWQWAISSTCKSPKEAANFIQHVIRTDEIADMASAAGMIPSTEAAAERTSRFRRGGDWRVFFDLSRAYAQQRPSTPAFTTISNAWYRAARDIMDGTNPRDSLDDAVDEIDQSIQDNGGFATVAKGKSR